MSVWFTRNLGDAMLAGESIDRIRESFLSEYEKSGRPAAMALFIRHESEGQLHCDVKVFFSPASASVAQAFDAVPCARPSHDGLGLLAGSALSWSILFPEAAAELPGRGE